MKNLLFVFFFIIGLIAIANDIRMGHYGQALILGGCLLYFWFGRYVMGKIRKE
jgi:hypothetical protein